MLLSLYASYHWAKISKKAYVLRMTVLVVLISFLSAYFSASEYYGLFFLLFWFPCFYASFLSFPFYAYNYKTYFVSEPYWARFHSIRFLTVDITSTPSWYHDLVYLIQHDLWGLQQLLITFSFFLFVNFLGALLGYLIAKKYRIQFFRSKWEIILCGVIAIACTIDGFILGSIDERIGITLFGFGIFLLETIILSKLGKLAVDFFTPYTASTSNDATSPFNSKKTFVETGTTFSFQTGKADDYIFVSHNPDWIPNKTKTDYACCSSSLALDYLLNNQRTS